MPGMKGKNALVTGGGSGIGRAIALEFAKRGARVLITGRRSDRLKQVAAAAPEGRISAARADVTVEEDRSRLVGLCRERMGGLDVLVNNAGILESGTIESTDLAAWDRSMEVNLRSVFALTRLTVPLLVQRKGNIINISSVAGLRPYPGLLAYCVSKAALDQLTRCLALELASRGVRVNAINPGVVVTDLHRSGGMSASDYAAFLQRSKTTHPLGRPGRPEEIASLAAFLASDDAGWITGGTHSIDGGRALASAR